MKIFTAGTILLDLIYVLNKQTIQIKSRNHNLTRVNKQQERKL